MHVRLIIVDGHAGVRAALAERLRRVPGIVVVGAVAEVPVAARASRELAPDVVIYEPRTTQGNPLASLRLLALGRPVVVWTTSLRRGEAEALLRAGAASVLLKDTNLTLLLAAVAMAVTGQHA